MKKSLEAQISFSFLVIGIHATNYTSSGLKPGCALSLITGGYLVPNSLVAMHRNIDTTQNKECST